MVLKVHVLPPAVTSSRSVSAEIRPPNPCGFAMLKHLPLTAEPRSTVVRADARSQGDDHAGLAVSDLRDGRRHGADLPVRAGLVGFGGDWTSADDLPHDVPHDFHGGTDAAMRTATVPIRSWATTPWGTATSPPGCSACCHSKRSPPRWPFSAWPVVPPMPADMGPRPSVTIAAAAGLAAMYGVHWIMRSLFRLVARTTRSGSSTRSARKGPCTSRSPPTKGQARCSSNCRTAWWNTPRSPATTNRSRPARRSASSRVVGASTVEVEPLRRSEVGANRRASR